MGKGAATSYALKIEKSDDGFTAKEIWKKTGSTHQYHAPLLKDGLIYGVSSGRPLLLLHGHQDR